MADEGAHLRTSSGFSWSGSPDYFITRTVGRLGREARYVILCGAVVKE
jgi:hypothetical protein